MSNDKRRPAQSINEQMQTISLPEVFTFNPSNQPVRVELINNEPWFVAKDLCSILEHTNHKVAIQALDEDEVRKVYLTDNLGRQQATHIVNESGMYALIIRSNKPQAKVFRKWVTSEVLPDLRKTGEYKLRALDNRPRRYIRRGELVNADILSLLWLIGEYLHHGDQARIAIDLGVSKQSVYNVLNGVQRSNRILSALYKCAKKNREDAALYIDPERMRRELLGIPAENTSLPLPMVYTNEPGGQLGNKNAVKKGGVSCT